MNLGPMGDKAHAFSIYDPASFLPPQLYAVGCCYAVWFTKKNVSKPDYRDETNDDTIHLETEDSCHICLIAQISPTHFAAQIKHFLRFRCPEHQMNTEIKGERKNSWIYVTSLFSRFQTLGTMKAGLQCL